MEYLADIVTIIRSHSPTMFDRVIIATARCLGKSNVTCGEQRIESVGLVQVSGNDRR